MRAGLQVGAVSGVTVFSGATGVSGVSWPLGSLDLVGSVQSAGQWGHVTGSNRISHRGRQVMGVWYQGARV